MDGRELVRGEQVTKAPVARAPVATVLLMTSLAAAGLWSTGACARAQAPGESAGREPVVGLPCEGCEAVFVGLPESLEARARIAPQDEPGEPLRIEGTVRNRAGEPVEGVIVYAYHTDARGIYPRDPDLRGTAAHRHGRLRAWAETGADGRYRFDTIRPASYPETTTPAHVHMHVLEPGCCTYYIDSIHFLDDPFLDAEERRRQDDGRGGSGLVTPEREDGVWAVERDVVLGEGVPGYPGG